MGTSASIPVSYFQVRENLGAARGAPAQVPAWLFVRSVPLAKHSTSTSKCQPIFSLTISEKKEYYFLIFSHCLLSKLEENNML